MMTVNSVGMHAPTGEISMTNETKVNMTFNTTGNHKHIRVFGEVEDNTMAQAWAIAENSDMLVLMADNHLGYSMPIGGVALYRNHVSPTAVGYDIGCGNQAVRLGIREGVVRRDLVKYVDLIKSTFHFGVGGWMEGGQFPEVFMHEEYKPAWEYIKEHIEFRRGKRDTSPINPFVFAKGQIGTIGGGNHYIDLFIDDDHDVWAGVHFGSRGFGYQIADHFIERGKVEGHEVAGGAVLLPIDQDIAIEYIACMTLAQAYASEHRRLVCNKIAEVFNVSINDRVENHHNFAEYARNVGGWLHRKGATANKPGKVSFVGGSMGDVSYIIKGKENPDEQVKAMFSTIHGAGRVMGRMEAKGRKGKPGAVTQTMQDEWVGGVDHGKGVLVVGAGVDESPQCYKRIDKVIEYHKATVEIVCTLTPIAVVMG